MQQDALSQLIDYLKVPDPQMEPHAQQSLLLVAQEVRMLKEEAELQKLKTDSLMQQKELATGTFFHFLFYLSAVGLAALCYLWALHGYATFAAMSIWAGVILAVLTPRLVKVLMRWLDC
ncbi:MAG TPA: hypothetical protein VEF04_04745 [Blastocatellia bacterium]|nr:hypothetical protein [Blastocatellia bacterium]